MTRIVAFWCLFALAVLGALGRLATWKRTDHDHIGKAVACAETCPFEGQAEVLLYGLEDVKGLAALDNKLYVVRDQGPPIVLSPDLPETYPGIPACAGSFCDVRDPGGIVAWNEKDDPQSTDDCKQAIRTLHLLIAEKGQIMELIQPAENPQIHPESRAFEKIDPAPPIPAGLAQTSGTLFFTADSVPAGRPDNVHQGSGSLMALPISSAHAGAKALTIASGLTRPSGVAVAGEHGPIYVTEDRADRVVWSIYSYSQGPNTWRRSGELAAVPRDAQSGGTFRGLALWKDGILASGPAGLYAFRQDGALLGIMKFDEPITGIAIDGEQVSNQSEPFVYLMVGHQLCRIKLTLPPSAREDQERCPKQPSGPLPPPPPPPHVQNKPHSGHPSEDCDC